MLSGQLRPTSGVARVAGCDVTTEQGRLKPLVGVVSEIQNLYERMSGRENLAFAARLYGAEFFFSRFAVGAATSDAFYSHLLFC